MENRLEVIAVGFDGIENFMSVMHLFPDEDTLTVTKTIAVDMEAGRDVLRNFLDGDEGVSFASGDPLVWVYDENEYAMRWRQFRRAAKRGCRRQLLVKGHFRLGGNVRVRRFPAMLMES